MQLIAIILIIICYLTYRWDSVTKGKPGTTFHPGSIKPAQNNKPSPRKAIRSDEEWEDHSFFDRDGIEHILDDDNFCEDCDDYHDD